MSEKNMSEGRRFATAEAVRAGHPDKFCDQLADMLLDEYLRGDPNTRAAIEVMAADGKILVAGGGYLQGQRGRGACPAAPVRGGGLYHGRTIYRRQPGAGSAA